MSQGMLGVSVHEARGVVGDLLEKLAGPNSKEWLVASKRFLRKENPWGDVIAFPVWKTIKLGTYKDAEALRAALIEGGYRVFPRVFPFLSQRVFIAEIELSARWTELGVYGGEVDLVVLSIADLGFPDGATYREVCDKAREHGLELCPAEVGPQLRLQYDDQPHGERLLIATRPFTDLDGYWIIFALVHDDSGRWLSEEEIFGVWTDVSLRLVFVRPRPDQPA